MSCPRVCDSSDLTKLCPQLDLWLKPHSKLTITVTLPTLRCSPNSGQCISTWEVMDKLKKRIKPLKLKSLKVIKSNLDFIRFEGECDSQMSLTQIESKLNNVSLKLSGFSQQLSVKTAKIKIGINLCFVFLFNSIVLILNSMNNIKVRLDTNGRVFSEIIQI
jgi:arginine/serine-rich splicing factor 17